MCNTKITRITGWRLHYCVPCVMGGSHGAENRVDGFLLAAGFEEIRTRAINDQLTAYPRKLAIELDERETYLDLVAQQRGLWTMPGGSERNVKFRLVCENDNCQNLNAEGKNEVYKANSFTSYLPRAGDIEKFFDAADIGGLTDQFEVAGKALLAVKLGLTISQYAHPVFAVGIIVLEAGLEDVVRRLQADVKDRQATRKLWELVRSSPYRIKDVGGPGHTQFGNLVRIREESEGSHVHKSFGGLSKWMNPETHTFSWVCPTDAYNFISQYRADANGASRSGGAAG